MSTEHKGEVEVFEMKCLIRGLVARVIDMIRNSDVRQRARNSKFVVDRNTQVFRYMERIDEG